MARSPLSFCEVLSELPQVDSVEIVVLSDAQYSVRVSGNDAQQIAELWRKMPPGNAARCHIPAYRLAFNSAGMVVCEATICWRCSNICIQKRGHQWKTVAFSSGSEPSQSLFRLLNQLAPLPDEPTDRDDGPIDESDVPDSQLSAEVNQNLLRTMLFRIDEQTGPYEPEDQVAERHLELLFDHHLIYGSASSTPDFGFSMLWPG